MKRWLWVVSASLLLAACAAPPYTLNFQPQGPPPQEWKRFGGQKLALLDVEDARAGNPGNLLYSGKDEKISLGQDPVAPLSEAFEKQLRFAGFEVIKVKSMEEAEQSGANRTLRITLEKLEVAPKDSLLFNDWVAKLGYRLDLYDDRGEPLAYGAGFYAEQEILGWRKQPTVQETLDDVVGKGIKDFLNSPGLQKYF